MLQKDKPQYFSTNFALANYVLQNFEDQESKGPQDLLDPQIYNSLSPKQVKRLSVMLEIQTTEKLYVRDLAIIIEIFMRPIQQNFQNGIKYSNLLFSNIEQIFKANYEFYLEIKKIDLTDSDAMAKIVNNYCSSFLAYIPFCASKQPASMKASKAILAKNEIKNFLEETYKNPVLRMLDLQGFLLKPVQRICKYPLLIKELLKNTNEGTNEFRNLQETFNKVQILVKCVNECSKHLNGIKTQDDVQSKFIDKLIIPENLERYLLREDAVTIIFSDEQKNRRMFLFNDQLLISKKDWRDRLHLISKYSLKEYLFNDVAVTSGVYLGSFLFEIEIINTNIKFLVSCPSQDVKDSWLDSYKCLSGSILKIKNVDEINILSSYDFEVEKDVLSPTKGAPPAIIINRKDSRKDEQIEDLERKLAQQKHEFEQQIETLKLNLISNSQELEKFKSESSKIESFEKANFENQKKIKELNKKLESKIKKIKDFEQVIKDKDEVIMSNSSKIKELENDYQNLVGSINWNNRLKNGYIKDLENCIIATNSGINELYISLIGFAPEFEFLSLPPFETLKSQVLKDKNELISQSKSKDKEIQELFIEYSEFKPKVDELNKLLKDSQNQVGKLTSKEKILIENVQSLKINLELEKNLKETSQLVILESLKTIEDLKFQINNESIRSSLYLDNVLYAEIHESEMKLNLYDFEVKSHYQIEYQSLKLRILEQRFKEIQICTEALKLEKTQILQITSSLNLDPNGNYIDSLQNSIKEFQDSLLNLNSEIRSKMNEIETQNEQIQTLNKLNWEFSKEINGLRERDCLLKSEISSKENEINSLKSKFEIDRSSNLNVLNSLESKQKIIDDLSHQLRSKEEEIKTLEISKNEIIVSLNASNSKKFLEYQTEVSKITTDYEHKISNLKSEHEMNIKDIISNFENETELRIKEIERFRTMNTKLEKDIEIFIGKIKDLELELNEKKETFKSKILKISESLKRIVDKSVLLESNLEKNFEILDNRIVHLDKIIETQSNNFKRESLKLVLTNKKLKIDQAQVQKNLDQINLMRSKLILESNLKDHIIDDLKVNIKESLLNQQEILEANIENLIQIQNINSSLDIISDQIIPVLLWTFIIGYITFNISQDKITLLEFERSNSLTTIQACENEIKDLKITLDRQNTKFKNDNAEFENIHIKLQNKIQELNEIISKKDFEIFELESKISTKDLDLQKHFEIFKDKIQICEERIHFLESVKTQEENLKIEALKEKESLNLSIKDLELKMKGLTMYSDTNQVALSDLQSLINSRENEISQLKVTIEKQIIEISELNQSKNKIQTSLDALHSVLQKSKTNEVKYLKENSNLNIELDLAKKQLDSKIIIHRDLEKSFGQEKEINLKLNSDLASLKSLLKDSISNFDKINRYNLDYIMIHEDITRRLSEKLYEAENEIYGLKCIYLEKIKINSQSNQIIRDLEQDLMVTKLDCNRFKHILFQKEVDENSLLQKYSDLLNECQYYKIKFENLEQESFIVKNSFETLKNTNIGLDNEFKALERKYSDSMFECKSLKSSNNALLLDLEKIKEDYKILESNNLGSSSQNQELLNLISQKKDEILNLEKHLLDLDLQSKLKIENMKRIFQIQLDSFVKHYQIVYSFENIQNMKNFNLKFENLQNINNSLLESIQKLTNTEPQIDIYCNWTAKITNSEIEKLKADLEGYKSNNKNLKSQITIGNDLLNHKNSLLNSQDSIIQQLEIKNKELEISIEKFKSKLESYVVESIPVNAFSEARLEISALNQCVLEKNLQDKQEEIQRLCTKIENLETEIQNMVSEKENILRNHNTRKSELKIQTEINDKLQNQLVYFKDMSTKKEKEISILDSENEDLNKTIQNLIKDNLFLKEEKQMIESNFDEILEIFKEQSLKCLEKEYQVENLKSELKRERVLFVDLEIQLKKFKESKIEMDSQRQAYFFFDNQDHFNFADLDILWTVYSQKDKRGENFLGYSENIDDQLDYIFQWISYGISNKNTPRILGFKEDPDEEDLGWIIYGLRNPSTIDKSKFDIYLEFELKKFQQDELLYDIALISYYLSKEITITRKVERYETKIPDQGLLDKNIDLLSKLEQKSIEIYQEKREKEGILLSLNELKQANQELLSKLKIQDRSQNYITKYKNKLVKLSKTFYSITIALNEILKTLKIESPIQNLQKDQLMEEMTKYFEDLTESFPFDDIQSKDLVSIVQFVKSKVTTIDNYISQYQQTIKILQNKYAELEIKSNETMEESIAIKSQNKNLKHQIEDLEKVKAGNLKLKDHLLSEMEDLVKEIGNLKKKETDYENKLLNVMKEKESLESDFVIVYEKNQSLRSRCLNLKSDFDGQKRDLDYSKSHVLKLQQENQKLSEQKIKSDAIIQNSMKSLRELSAEVQKLKKVTKK